MEMRVLTNSLLKENIKQYKGYNLPACGGRNNVKKKDGDHCENACSGARHPFYVITGQKTETSSYGHV